ncbi:MAG: Gfo/Idh/MocA family oxidoreductase [Kiritimatiellaeota bacterium]|nr:Gfo/Idh/MocA family oxidoreductase [Kiritimatiellota bacterium]
MNLNTWSRRQFLTAAAATAAFAGLSARADETAPRRMIKLGVIGNGGRGSWIANLFKKHGGYAMHAVCDYFPAVADRCGDVLGVDKTRRFSGLSGYQRLIASGVEAVTLETPPYFLPGHAQAAVAAGLHVYMAKPVAVDVPGCLAIAAAGQAATAKQRVFLVDYQVPTDPLNIEVVQRIRAGALGKLLQVQTFGVCGGFGDSPKTATIESRLQHLVWVNDVALGGDYIGNFDIHAIDAALWAIGQRPVAALGASQIGRANAHGDARGVCSVVYEYADGLVHNHFGQGLANACEGVLEAVIHGTGAHAQINYWGKAFLRGGDRAYKGGTVENLYEAGAVRNIAAFHTAITQGDCGNPTAARAVDGCLTCILGREAAARHARLTMDDLLKENQKLEVDLKGLKT